MKKQALFIITTIFFITSCTSPSGKNETTSEPLPKGPYFGQTASMTAQMFAEGIVSREFQELNAVFSPDGKEFYYTLADANRNFYSIVFYKQNAKGEWEGPEVAPFSGSYSDADPYFSSDGQRLFFISKRPLNNKSDQPKDFDIWVVDRTESGWGEPVNVGTPVNTEVNEYYVSVTDDFSIFYSANYDERGLGYGDIYEARLDENGKYVIENCGEAINSSTGEGDPYVSPDGKMMIFMSWGRPDQIGNGDLYISFKKDGKWSKAKNLGKRINTNAFEYCPMMSPDGKYFFWTSYRTSSMSTTTPRTYEQFEKRLRSADNGLGNVYWIDAKVLEEFRD